VTTGRPEKAAAKAGAPHPAAVEAFLAGLDHPHEREILALREILLAADTSIAEGIKRNSLSFRTTEYFATVNLRARDGVRVILHRGARTRDAGAPRPEVDDPSGLLTWLAVDRASMTPAPRCESEARRDSVAPLVRQWIRCAQRRTANTPTCRGRDGPGVPSSAPGPAGPPRAVAAVGRRP
jgi:hypothetical protein